MTYKELPPIPRSPEDFDSIEEFLIEMFREEIYLPLLVELATSDKKLLNSLESLTDAITSGRITFRQGKFTGKFSAQLSKELKKLGATWKNRAWNIPLSQLPQEISNAIRVSESRAKDAFERLDKKLSEIPEMKDKGKLSDLFDKTLWKEEQKFQKQVKSITVAPQLSAKQRREIAENYSNNMELYIKDFKEKEIKELRGKIQKAYFAGKRNEGMIAEIQKSYGVSTRKAKFLARQETNLLYGNYQVSRLKDIGVKNYLWKSVKGTAAHPVRPRHQALNDASQLHGKVFNMDDPPIVSEPGQAERKANAGFDYNCRCRMSPIVKF